jgi:hypothetical protein
MGEDNLGMFHVLMESLTSLNQSKVLSAINNLTYPGPLNIKMLTSDVTDKSLTHLIMALNIRTGCIRNETKFTLTMHISLTPRWPKIHGCAAMNVLF